MQIIVGKNVQPGDKIIIRGMEQVVESTRLGSNKLFNHLRLISGLTWPVRADERLIQTGQADSYDLTGVPEDER